MEPTEFQFQVHFLVICCPPHAKVAFLYKKDENNNLIRCIKTRKNIYDKGHKYDNV